MYRTNADAARAAVAQYGHKAHGVRCYSKEAPKGSFIAPILIDPEIVPVWGVCVRDFNEYFLCYFGAVGDLSAAQVQKAVEVIRICVWKFGTADAGALCSEIKKKFTEFRAIVGDKVVVARSQADYRSAIKERTSPGAARKEIAADGEPNLFSKVDKPTAAISADASSVLSPMASAPEKSIEKRNLKEDLVNSPSHYDRLSVKVSPVDVNEHFSTNLGAAIKYLLRAGAKAGSTKELDLAKSKWYLQRWLEMTKAEDDPEEAVTDPHAVAATILVLGKAKTLLCKNVYGAAVSLLRTRPIVGGMKLEVYVNAKTCRDAIKRINDALADSSPHAP